MGLDITHYKISFEETDTIFFLKEEIENEMVGNNFISNTVYRNKLVNDYWELVAIFESEEQLDIAKKELEKQITDIKIFNYSYPYLIVK